MTLQGNLTPPKLVGLRAGVLRVKTAKLRLRGPVPWRMDTGSHTLLGKAAKRSKRAAAAKLGQDQASHEGPRSSEVTLPLTCPHCETARLVRTDGLMKGAGWKTLTCSSCHRQRRSHRWLCAHGVPWHTCPEHRRVGIATLPSTPAPKRRRRDPAANANPPGQPPASSHGDANTLPCPTVVTHTEARTSAQQACNLTSQGHAGQLPRPPECR